MPTVTEPEVVKLLLSSQEQIRSEIGNLARVTAAQGAKLDGVEDRVEDLQASVQRIHQYTVECPARGGWQGLKEDLSEIRIMVGAHDREISENVGYRQGKQAARGFRDTPKQGNDTRSLSPAAATFSLSVKDPKVWGKIVFYTLVGAMAAASFAAQFMR
jgi:hypothetical protein